MTSLEVTREVLADLRARLHALETGIPCATCTARNCRQCPHDEPDIQRVECTFCADPGAEDYPFVDGAHTDENGYGENHPLHDPSTCLLVCLSCGGEVAP